MSCETCQKVREIFEDDRECDEARTMAEEVAALDRILNRIYEAVREPSGGHDAHYV